MKIMDWELKSLFDPLNSNIVSVPIWSKKTGCTEYSYYFTNQSAPLLSLIYTSWIPAGTLSKKFDNWKDHSARLNYIRIYLARRHLL
jgi:hypothetical protein